MRESNARLLIAAIICLGLFGLNAFAGSAVFFLDEANSSEMYTGKMTDGWFFSDWDSDGEVFVEGDMTGESDQFVAEDESCGLTIASQADGDDIKYVVSAPEQGTACAYANGKSVFGTYLRN